MDFILAQLALVFAPGIIWANIDAKFGSGTRPDSTTLFIRAFLFGITTYSILFLIYGASGRSFGYQDLVLDSSALNLFELKDEIAASIPLSFGLSIIWLWIVRFRLLKRFLHGVAATRRYGDEDVWSYTFNTSGPSFEYVHFRDIENGYIFAGWISIYSESEECRELVLRDAIVYNSEGDEISRSPLLYLSRPRNNIWVEFPYESEGE